MPLILTNSYQITSILYMVLSIITVSVFIEKKKLNRLSSLAPAPFLGILGCFSQKLWGHRVSAHLRLSGLDFYVSGIFRIIPRGYFFVWPKFDVWALQVLDKFWARNMRREIRLSNGDQIFRIWSVSR